MLRLKVFKDAAETLISGDEQCAVCAIRWVTPGSSDEHRHMRDGIGFDGSARKFAPHDEWVRMGLEANLVALAFAAVVKPEELRR